MANDTRTSAGARLVDVAAAAGVSLRTASRVLNDDHRVARATRVRVRAAMDDLDFQPDEMARSLRAGTDTAIGFVVESIADPFFAEVIETVESELARHGRAVLVASTHRDPALEQAVIRRMAQRRVAGLLVAPTGRSDDWLRTTTFPVVLVDRAMPGELGTRTDLVDIDDRAAAYSAVTHLLDHGHRHIAYIGDGCEIPTSAARLGGYHDALRARGIAARDDLVASSVATTPDAAAAAERICARTTDVEPVTAIFSATTRASLGVVPVLHAMGRTDVAFVGLGDFAMADALVPAVTVVDHSGRRIGRAAAECLLARLEKPDLAPRHIRLDVPLIERGSGELRP